LAPHFLEQIPMAPSSLPAAPAPGVDQQLSQLFDAASVALRERRRIIVLGLGSLRGSSRFFHSMRTWDVRRFMTFCPFIHELGILSFRSEDERLLDAPLYNTTAALGRPADAAMDRRW
jgi:hypothetical protein